MILHVEAFNRVLHIEYRKPQSGGPEPEQPPDNAPQPMIVYAEPVEETIGFHLKR